MCICQDKRVLTCIILDFYAVVHQTFWYFHLLVSCIGIVMNFIFRALAVIGKWSRLYSMYLKAGDVCLGMLQ